MKTVRRVLVAGAIVVVSIGSGLSGANASPPQTSTENAHGIEETFVDTFPTCSDGANYEITTVSNIVEHVTEFDDGRVHVTFTQTGTFVGTPFLDPTLPDVSGRFTLWGGFNDNGKTVNGTFTFNLRGVTDDGERISFHTTVHFNVRPNGTVNEFFRCRD